MTKQQTLHCIHEEMARNDVVLLMKGTPNTPERGFFKDTARFLERGGTGDIKISAGQTFAGTETRP